MKIYLAAQYSRREELCVYRERLIVLGHAVTARWLNGSHQIDAAGVPLGDHGERLVEGDGSSLASHILRQTFAHEDVIDVSDCELLMAFTEEPYSVRSRGGRHVELGLALAWGKETWIVGPRENVFCYLPHVRQFDTFENALVALRR